MTSYTFKYVLNQIRKAVSIFIIVCFIVTSIKSPVYAQPALRGMLSSLPNPGVMVHLSPEYTPALLKGIIIHPENAFKFDFIVEKGDKVLAQSQKKREYTKLIKYFLASLAVPEDNQWVNLSPYEKDRIIKDDFGKTEMGRDLLAQDYLLKQITASLIYPGENLGKKFWDKIYDQAYKRYGTTNIPVNTFNKVWIIPNSATVYERGNMVYVVSQHLKVMLEEDYLSLQKHSGIMSNAGQETGGSFKAHAIGSRVVREVVLPALEREVNEGRNFAMLRQVYSGVILAAWYKYTLKESLLGKIYSNKDKIKGVDQDPKNNLLIYKQYLKAFKKGVFNFIKEDVDKYTQEIIPRKYFSGGTRVLTPEETFGPNGVAKHASQATAVENMAMIGPDVVNAYMETPEDSGVIAAKAKAGMTVDEFKHGSDIIPMQGLLPFEKAVNETIKAGLTPEISNPEQVQQMRALYPNARLAQAVMTGELAAAVKADANVLISDGMLSKKDILGAQETASSLGKSVVIIVGVDNSKIMADVDVQKQIALAVANGADGVKIKPAGHGQEEQAVRLIQWIRTEYPKIAIMVAAGVTADNRQMFKGTIAGIGAKSIEAIPGAAHWSEGFKAKTGMTVEEFKHGSDVIPMQGLFPFEKAVDETIKAGLTPEISNPEQVQQMRALYPNARLAQAVMTGELAAAVKADANVLISDGMLSKEDILGAQETASSLGKSVVIIVGVDNSKTMADVDVQKQVALAVANGADGVKIKPAGHGQDEQSVRLIQWIRTEYPKIAIMVAAGVTADNRQMFKGTIAGIGAKSIEAISGAAHWKENLIPNTMTATATQADKDNSTLGGIDFNSANLNLQIKRDGKGVPLPTSQQDLKNMHIDGLIPVIISIKPVTLTPLFS